MLSYCNRRRARVVVCSICIRIVRGECEEAKNMEQLSKKVEDENDSSRVQFIYIKRRIHQISKSPIF